jgi:tRNA pseudouridine55 synthase
VGGFGLDAARTLEELAAELAVVPLAAAAGEAFPVIRLSEIDAARLRHGQRVPMDIAVSPSAAIGPDGSLVALVEDRGGVAQPICVFAGSAQ